MTNDVHPGSIDPSKNIAARNELGDRVQPEDAGIRASDKMREKRSAAAKAKFVFKVIVWLTILLALALIAGVGYYGYKHRDYQYLVVERKCSVMMTTGEPLAGTRTYSQRQYTYFGQWHVIDKSQTTEKTRVEIRGNALTVIGINTLKADEETPKDASQIDKSRYFWTKNAGMGEQGYLVLDPATSYTFVIDKKGVGVVDYEQFCR